MKPSAFLRRRGRLLLLTVVLLLLLLMACFALDQRMIVREYVLEDERITSPLRIALVTDLHSCRYGENQSQLITAVHDLSPHLLLLGGDIFDDEIEDTNTALFLAGMTDIPSYYVTGNHEIWSGEERFRAQMALLEQYGVTILSGQAVTLTIDGQTINLCGVDDPDAHIMGEEFYRQLETVAAVGENGHYTILLSHRPELIPQYAAYSFDLALCGHAHGGQWRIPFLLNGLYAPNQGLFPAYAGGRCETGDLTAIVSRGLARETTRIPRIFNRPELVVVEIR